MLRPPTTTYLRKIRCTAMAVVDRRVSPTTPWLRFLLLPLRAAQGFGSGQAVHAKAKSELPPDPALREPASLFKKLDESVVEEEYARLAGRRERGIRKSGSRGARAPALCCQSELAGNLTICT